MKLSRILLSVAVVLATTACATHEPRPVVGVAPPMPARADQPVAGSAPPAESAAVSVLIPDPWEGMNRRIHGFNDTADRWVLGPIARGYKRITPEPVREGVSRFFANLGMPVTVVNQALQGRPGEAGRSLGRFAVNMTVGIAGVFDPATRFGLPKGEDEDFGQTLATWGWSESRYLVLPLLGPRTVRDTVGIVGDRPLSPIGQIQDGGAANLLQAAEVVDTRTRLLPLDQLRRDALDDYSFVRDAWAQRRRQQIRPEPHGRSE